MLAVALESVDDTINARVGWLLLADCVLVAKRDEQECSILRAGWT